MRLDRLATLHFSQPMMRMLRGRNASSIPILMYHAVEESNSQGNAYYDTKVSPQVFASQIRQLRDNGFKSVSLAEALQALRHGLSDEKLVVITFDDGYRDFYEQAFPVLSSFRFTATVFLMTAFVEDLASTFKGKGCLSWPQIRELHAHGIHFGSHTVSHPYLKFLEIDQVEQEVSASKKTIEDQLGAAVESFSYPYAFPEVDHAFTGRLKDLLIKHGYKNGVTTILGTASAGCDPFFLPRLPVNEWDDPRFFGAKLEGAYNWLHGPQYLSKLVERFRSGRSQGRSEPVTS